MQVDCPCGKDKDRIEKISTQSTDLGQAVALEIMNAGLCPKMAEKVLAHALHSAIVFLRAGCVVEWKEGSHDRVATELMIAGAMQNKPKELNS